MKLDIIKDDNLSIRDKIIKVSNLSDEQVKQLEQTNIELSSISDINFNKAKERILLAKHNNEKVFVAGDYDCDGIMATTIIKDLLDRLGIENGYYIPNRFNEGYGLSENTINLIHDKGYTLVITVDNGVKAYDALNKCKEYNIDVILTDHHTMEDELDVYTILHPTLMDKQFINMCGAGVALYLSRMFFNIDKHIVLAMIATIGDMMPVWNENRLIIKKGLELLNNSDYYEFKCLLNKKNILNETDISFNIVPKINAIGRLNQINVNSLVKYFSSNDNIYINKFKDIINNQNDIRKKISLDMTNKALENINDNDNIIVIYDDNYHEGMCGLVAGSITNKLNKPTIVLSHSDNKYKGSGRSIDNINLYNILDEYKDLYMSFGGHAKAIGISISDDNINEFINIIKNIKIDTKEEIYKVIDININDLTIDNINEINKLRPFGVDFKQPLFYIDKFNVLSKTLIKGMYPKWILESKNKVEAISFQIENNIDANYFLFEPSINVFNRVESVSLLVKKVG